MRLAARLATTVLALTLVLGMGVHYDVIEDRHWPYPSADDLALDYGANVGERTLLWGTVASIDPSASMATIVVEHDQGALSMTVRGFEADVEPGGTVQVLGTLEDGQSLTAERVVVVNQSGSAERLKLGLSGVGSFVVIVAFFSRWRIAFERYVFEAR